MSKKKKAITPTREEDFSEWYQQVIKAAQLADHSVVRGCMVIRPWGYAIWELIQRELDRRMKERGILNGYFPLFIPLSFLEKEAAHVEGFAKECAVVTHHRLEQVGGKLIPVAPLEEPLVVRPTSETIIGHSFSQWVRSYRDLPMKINQWANVVRWEMRTRLFLRTTEFLWQEGHSVHETAQEAKEHALAMANLYQDFAKEVLALYPYMGEKPMMERFPGAAATYSLEMMMQDGKALQGGTSHDLGQNFSKAQEIRFNSRDERLEYAYTTSWGMTTRLIGALIMTHGDDDGLRLPPMVAPYQIVIQSVAREGADLPAIHSFSESLKRKLETLSWRGNPLRCHLDLREMTSGEKKWDWIKKGVPLRIEIGQREVEEGIYPLFRRDREANERELLPLSSLLEKVLEDLETIQEGMLMEAKGYRDRMTYSDVATLEEMKRFFEEGGKGLVLAPFCDKDPHADSLEGTKITVRCMPFEADEGVKGECILSGEMTTRKALFGLAY